MSIGTGPGGSKLIGAYERFRGSRKKTCVRTPPFCDMKKLHHCDHALDRATMPIGPHATMPTPWVIKGIDTLTSANVTLSLNISSFHQCLGTVE
jgi:hypothetical protein